MPKQDATDILNQSNQLLKKLKEMLTANVDPNNPLIGIVNKFQARIDQFVAQAEIQATADNTSYLNNIRRELGNTLLREQTIQGCNRSLAKLHALCDKMPEHQAVRFTAFIIDAEIDLQVFRAEDSIESRTMFIQIFRRLKNGVIEAKTIIAAEKLKADCELDVHDQNLQQRQNELVGKFRGLYFQIKTLANGNQEYKLNALTEGRVILSKLYECLIEERDLKVAISKAAPAADSHQLSFMSGSCMPKALTYRPRTLSFTPFFPETLESRLAALSVEVDKLHIELTEPVAAATLFLSEEDHPDRSTNSTPACYI
jgi:hypothetical protein